MPPRVDDPGQERLRSHPMDDAVDRQAIDQHITQSASKTLQPQLPVQVDTCSHRQRGPVELDPLSRLRYGRVAQNKAQELGEVALRSADGRELPVVGAER